MPGRLVPPPRAFGSGRMHVACRKKQLTYFISEEWPGKALEAGSIKVLA